MMMLLKVSYFICRPTHTHLNNFGDTFLHCYGSTSCVVRRHRRRRHHHRMIVVDNVGRRLRLEATAIEERGLWENDDAARGDENTQCQTQ